eukprot:scpid90747/ scgid16663/ 
MTAQGSWISPRPFFGKENEDFEAFLLDFDMACDANGWINSTPLARPIRPSPVTRGETTADGLPELFSTPDSARHGTNPFLNTMCSVPEIPTLLLQSEGLQGD